MEKNKRDDDNFYAGVGAAVFAVVLLVALWVVCEMKDSIRDLENFKGGFRTCVNTAEIQIENKRFYMEGLLHCLHWAARKGEK